MFVGDLNISNYFKKIFRKYQVISNCPNDIYKQIHKFSINNMNKAFKSFKTLKRDHVYHIYSNNITHCSIKFKIILLNI